jgi:predicted TIM-barrel fold metal-dependent hydrolase
MTDLGFRLFDCDNHYYEALDAFTRYIDPRYAKRAMQWAVVNGKARLLVGEKVNKFIPNPTFDPISKPGALDEYFRGRNPAGQDTRGLFGDLDRMDDHPEYRDREARLTVMDRQGLDAAIFLPTLAVGMEQALLHDPEALVAAFRAFNRWLIEDWGFAYRDRIFAAPLFTLVDADAAVAEVEWALAEDARFLLLLPGPVITSAGGRSPSDPAFDPFWARINEAGATVVVHGGDSWYSSYLSDWGESSMMEAFRASPFRSLASAHPTQDTFANLLARHHFQRFPNIRMAAIETGSEWVLHLHQKLKRSFGQTPHAYPEDPRETFRRHVWVSPFYEDPLDELRDLLGPDHILMGSDFPHAEGLAEPASYVKDLRNFDFTDDEVRLVMRDNGRRLSTRQPA